VTALEESKLGRGTIVLAVVRGALVIEELSLVS